MSQDPAEYRVEPPCSAEGVPAAGEGESPLPPADPAGAFVADRLQARLLLEQWLAVSFGSANEVLRDCTDHEVADLLLAEEPQQMQQAKRLQRLAARRRFDRLMGQGK